MIFSKAQRILQKHDCTEFRQIIFNVETVFSALYDSVATADGDIIDSYFTFVASSEFEIRFLICHSKHMDVTRCILVEWHRLKQDVLATGLRLINIDEFEERLAFSEDVRIALLANLAFKFLPVV